MSEELKQVVTLLEKVVETNQQVMRQNERFLGFLESRDARIPERTALEIERLTNDNQKYALELKVLKDLGMSQEELMCDHFVKERALMARTRRLAGDLGNLDEELAGCRAIASAESKELKDGKPIDSVGFDEDALEVVVAAEPHVMKDTGGPQREPERRADPKR